MKLYMIPGAHVAIFVYAVKEVCTLHRRGLLVVASSYFLTISPTESLLLIFIEGLILPTKPSTLYEVRCHGYISWVVKYIRI